MSSNDEDGVILGLSSLSLGEEDRGAAIADDDESVVPGYSRYDPSSLGCSEDEYYQVNLSNYTRLLELLTQYGCDGDENYMVLWEFQKICEEIYSGPMYEGLTMYGLEGMPWFHMRLGTWEDHCFIHGDDFLDCPTWGEFCLALKRCPSVLLDGVSIINVMMTKGFITGIGPMLEAGTDLHFERCILGSQGLHYLADHLEGNSSLMTMRYFFRGEGRELKDICAVERFFEEVKWTPIRDFSMGRSLRTEDPQVLSIIMDGVKDVRKLSFCWMVCPSEGHRIATVLAENPAVERLFVGCHSFGPSDALDFANGVSFLPCSFHTNRPR